jgi:hypothetical protein
MQPGEDINLVQQGGVLDHQCVRHHHRLRERIDRSSMRQ